MEASCYWSLAIVEDLIEGKDGCLYQDEQLQNDPTNYQTVPSRGFRNDTEELQIPQNISDSVETPQEVTTSPARPIRRRAATRAC